MRSQNLKKSNTVSVVDENKGGRLGNPAATLISVFIFTVPLQLYFNIYGSLSVSIAQLIACALFVTSLPRLLAATNGTRLILSGSSIPVAALMTAMALSIAVSDSPAVSIKYFLKWSMNIAVFFVALAHINHLVDVKRFLKVILLGAMFISIVAAVEYFSGPDRVVSWFSTSPLAPIIMEPDTLKAKLAGLRDNFNWIAISIDNARTVRAFGTFECVVAFSAFLGLCIPFLPWLIRCSVPGRRMIPVISAVITLLALLFTNTRSAYLSALVAASVWLLAVKRRLTQRQRIILILSAGSCAILFFFLPISIQDSTLSRLLYKPTDMRFSRPVLWQQALKITVENPLLGVGVANYASGFRRYIIDSPDIPPLPAHNNFLQLSAETGVIGAAIFIVIVISGIVWSVRIIRIASGETRYIGWGFLSLWIWFAVQGQFDTYLFGEKFAMLFWFMTGMNARLYYIVKLSAPPGRIQ